MSEQAGPGAEPDPTASPAPGAGPPVGPGQAEPAPPAEAGPDAGGASARIAELEDLWRRTAAEVDNLRKRCAAQVGQAEAAARAAGAREWLPVIDNLERALAYARADPATIIDGIQGVRDQALDVVARLGYPRREDQGTRFDPARHDAVATRADPGAENGSVLEVVRPAYGDGDHQLRPAQVVVTKGG